ncbi:hypothetical protein TNIN_458181 [Trichonephila inaurata madagascariensis]|uniref:Uncharacterized protein n=1 Tax=Trichonephila inaurata madagascariensis TaxID=2747483 RepID=A0A8X7CAC5_9ARAC|nr:hypothetical protein TNIN_458181 [Trichonephila inaurata madagascariensis]
MRENVERIRTGPTCRGEKENNPHKWQTEKDNHDEKTPFGVDVPVGRILGCRGRIRHRGWNSRYNRSSGRYQHDLSKLVSGHLLVCRPDHPYSSALWRRVLPGNRLSGRRTPYDYEMLLNKGCLSNTNEPFETNSRDETIVSIFI